MKETISLVYPGLPVQIEVLINGIPMPSLDVFTAIIKTDPEINYLAFRKMFSKGADGYSEKEIAKTWNLSKPFNPRDLFTDPNYSNSELRAAILGYLSPDKVFSVVESNPIDMWEVDKEYPTYSVKNIHAARDSSRVSSSDIKIGKTERREVYTLIRIMDKEVLKCLDYRVGMVLLLKMHCPSSNKDYYEYIDPSIFNADLYNTRKYNTFRDDAKWEPGELVRTALCWQMRKENGSRLSDSDYSSMIQET